MALFEFEDGRLVPAQFGYPVAHDLGPELVDAICQQVLQIVSRPLFPVTWRDMTGQGDEETPRLTSLDVTGQIVSVEILKELDSETLIASLSRLAEVASISWSDLAAEYPSGPEGFRTGWTQFRDSMPPAVGPGPRLIMVAGSIDPSVRPALSVLATSGVEVHLMNLRQMSNGRLFLDVNAVGPRLYGHAPQVLASAAAAPELTAAEPAVGVDGADRAQTSAEHDALDGAEDSGEAEAETPMTRPTPKVSPRLRDVFSYPVGEEPPAPWQPGDADETEPGAQEAPSDGCGDQTVGARGGDERVEARGEEQECVDTMSDADPDAVEDKPVGAVRGQVDAADGEAGEAEGRGLPGAAERVDLGDCEEPEDDARAESVEECDQASLATQAIRAKQADTVDPADAGDGEAGEAEPREWPGAAEQIDAPEQADTPKDDPMEAAPDQETVPEQEDALGEEEPRWERPAHLGSRVARRAQTEELNDDGATDAATASFVDRAEESAEVIHARENGVPVLNRDESGLRTLAQILGEDTPLVARGELGLPSDLVLAASGAISGAGLTYPSLETLLTARGLGHIRAWAQVRIGDRLGPTLAEALDEINREIVREYSQAPRARRAAKH
ncbi:hypothetical protein HMPREF2946_07985 [Actinomyces sp. HMSC062G12]|nr:hypothetical protein HMPREF2946_07985 [Actinomyces sp. HMSC062G12]